MQVRSHLLPLVFLTHDDIVPSGEHLVDLEKAEVAAQGMPPILFVRPDGIEHLDLTPGSWWDVRPD